MKTFLILYFLSSFYKHVHGEEDHLPSYISVCYRDDPKVADCLKREIQRLLPILKSGSKEFHLAPLDPLVMPSISLKYPNNLLGGSIVIAKTTIFGLSNAKVLRVRPKFSDPKKLLIDFDVHLDKSRTKAYYNFTGNVERIPVNMDGDVDVEFGDISITYKLIANVKEVDGRDFLFLESFRLKYTGDTPRTFQILNDHLVNNKPVLNRLVVTIVKATWSILKNSLVPKLQVAQDGFFRDHFYDFFKRFPYDAIFPSTTPKN